MLILWQMKPLVFMLRSAGPTCAGFAFFTILHPADNPGEHSPVLQKYRSLNICGCVLQEFRASMYECEFVCVSVCVCVCACVCACVCLSVSACARVFLLLLKKPCVCAALFVALHQKCCCFSTLSHCHLPLSCRMSCTLPSNASPLHCEPSLD